MSSFHVHRSNPGKSGPPNDPAKPPPRPSSPRWLHFVWLIGLLATLLLLFTPSSSPSTTSLSFTDWKTKVDADQVKTATIDQSGKVTGQLNDKSQTHYTSRIPIALNDNTLAADLETHHVTVKGTASSTSFWSVVGGLLPLFILVGVYFWISRRATRQLAGGFMGIGSSKAKVYDEERPKKRFSDVAGYEGAKREISEVVDFLKRPDRYAAAGGVEPPGDARSRAVAAGSLRSPGRDPVAEPPRARRDPGRACSRQAHGRRRRLRGGRARHAGLLGRRSRQPGERSRDRGCARRPQHDHCRRLL